MTPRNERFVGGLRDAAAAWPPRYRQPPAVVAGPRPSPWRHVSKSLVSSRIVSASPDPTESLTGTGTSVSDRLSHLYTTVVAVAEALHRRRLAVALVLAPVLTARDRRRQSIRPPRLPELRRRVQLSLPSADSGRGPALECPAGPAPRSSRRTTSSRSPAASSAASLSDGRWCWPSAIRLGLPVWLVNPLLGTLTLGLSGGWVPVCIAAARGRRGRVPGRVSPFFLFNAASYFSHTFCGALLLSAAARRPAPDRRPAVGADRSSGS